MIKELARSRLLAHQDKGLASELRAPAKYSAHSRKVKMKK